AQSGAGINNSSSNGVTIRNSTLAGNVASGSGGAIVNSGALTLVASPVAYNASAGVGAGIVTGSPNAVTLIDGIVSVNDDSNIVEDDISGPAVNSSSELRARPGQSVYWIARGRHVACSAGIRVLTRSRRRHRGQATGCVGSVGDSIGWRQAGQL